MKKYIIIRTRFNAIHCWKGAPEEVNYLRSKHRHVFHVEIKKEVKHNDREIEFIMFKTEVDSFINESFHNKDLSQTSCETIAETLLHFFDADSVSVFEDGENGALIEK